MARPKKMSDAQKRRILERQAARHKAAAAKAEAKLEACLSCNADKLERDLARLDDEYTRERKALEAKYGVTSVVTPKAKRQSKKAAKKAAKVASAATPAKSAKKATKRKAAKKKTAKKVTKKAAKKSAYRERA